MRFLVLLFLFFTTYAYPQEVLVRIFSAYNTRLLDFKIESGIYTIEVNDSTKIDLESGVDYKIKLSGTKVFISGSGIPDKSFDTLRIINTDTISSAYLKMADLRIKPRWYSGSFKVYASKGNLQILNRTSLEDYLCGVIETEGGGGKHLEYYKVQAVLSRTFYFGHMTRHENEGYQLCDEVHCQAYKSKLRHTPSIRDAVRDTRDLIALDSTLEVVSGLFSANCGGQTSETDWIWNKSTHYLKTTLDPFCTNTYQAKWTERIPKYQWRKFLVEQYNFPEKHPFFKDSLYTFHQPHRKAFYHGQELGIPLRDIRHHFKLKSTFFSCHPEGEYVVLEGRGFGHGVGMCQEGAMNMAVKGYDYRQIIHFYFSGVRLINYHLWMDIMMKE